jgi:tetratricopeptide (TPR) repeat protein
VLALVPPRATLVPAVAELLARAARRLLTLEGAPTPETLLGVAERLALCGHLTASQDLLEALHVAPGTSAELTWLTLRVRYGDPARTAADVQRLEAVLAAGQLAPEQLHRGYRALAEREGSTDVQSRRAWRQALATLATCDLGERAGLHVALARSAERAGHRRAVAGHARRAAVLHEALGRTGEAASLWLHVGLVERAAGRLQLATAAFEAAVRDWQTLGEAAAEGEALEAQAQTCVLRARYDEAAGLLGRALACNERGGRIQRRAGVHLALARAHRGRGDLAREREHAARALEHATTTGARLLARAAQLLGGLRAGEPGALEALDGAVRDLEAAGLREEAAEVRTALVDARLVIGDVAEAERLMGTLEDPSALLAKARVSRLKGQLGACTQILETVGRDPTAPVDLRAEAFARLADLQVENHAEREAVRTAQSASALLELPHRSRRQDARLHRLLARVYRGVGEPARSAEHRAASRRALQLPQPVRGTASERLRWIRARWSRDPRHAHAPRAQAL